MIDNSQADEPYTLDGAVVAEEILKVGNELKTQIRALLGGAEATFQSYSTWINTLADGSPERRWAALDANYIISRTLFGNIGGATRADFKEMMGQLANPELNLSEDARAGILDASVLLVSKTPVEEGLKDDWFWYVTSECSNERYINMLGALISASCALVSYFAKESKVSSVSLWDKIVSAA